MKNIKVVTVTKKSKSSISKRIDLDSINYLKNIHPGKYECVDLYHKGELLLSPKKLCRKYRPNIVICHEHDRVFDYGFFNKLSSKVLKVMIAVDLWKLFNLDSEKCRPFYKNNRFDLIFHRHWMSKKYKREISKELQAPLIWWPYAVDYTEFSNFQNLGKRDNKIAFVGTSDPKWVYWQRNEAIRKLEENHLLVNYGRKPGEQYPKILGNHSVVLNSSELYSPYGRVFEILASKTVPLTPPFGGRDKLFSKDCTIEYKYDCSDVAEKGLEAIKNPDWVKELASNGYKEILEKHTFDKRVWELWNNIIQYYKGKSLKWKWES